LASQADAVADRDRIAGHVDAEHLGAAAVGAQDGREDADCRGLAGPVGPSNPNTVPAGTEKSIPPSAVREPNFLVRCSTRTAWSLREDPPTLLIARVAAPILRGPVGVAPSHGSGTA
jgi:hypothetical protein